jgi:Secretion system C-terminal sorting domain
MTFPPPNYVSNIVANASYVGIFLSNVTFNINGGVDKNQFIGNPNYSASSLQNLNQGIVGVSSIIDIKNCIFKYIRTCYDPGGQAIWGDNSTLTQTGLGMTPNGGGTNATFENCDNSIRSSSSNLTSTNNYMKNVGTGYLVQISSNRKVNIGYNTVDCNYLGIESYLNDAATEFKVYNNSITVGNNGVVGNGVGIKMSGNAITNLQTAITDNIVKLYQANDGISLNSIKSVLVRNNHVQMNNPTYNRRGIFLSGCQNATVECGDVVSTGISINDNQRAVYLSSTINSGISCISIDNTNYGIRVDGTCTGTILKANNFAHHTYGLYIGTMGLLSDQVDKGNRWGTNLCSVKDIINTGNTAYSRFKVNPFVLPFKPNLIVPQPNGLPTDWFSQSTGSPFLCQSGSFDYCANNNLSLVSSSDEIDKKIALGEVETLEYTETMNFQARQYLFEKLSMDSILRLSDIDFQTFYSAESQSNLEDFKYVVESSEMLYNMTVSLRNQIDQNILSIEQNLQQLNLNNEQISNGILSEADKTVLENTNNLLQKTNNSLLLFNENAMAALNNNRIMNADNLKLSNNGILANANYELNKKLVNEIYLETIAKNSCSFTPLQISDLLSISEQCPFSGGNAVYVARGLYSIVDPRKDYNDQAICLSEGVVLRQASPKQIGEQGVFEYVSLFPNPASNSLTIKCELGKDVDGKIEMYNSYGQKVKSVPLNANEKSLVIDIKGLAIGVYSYSVKSTTGFLQKGKLVISR